jgi:hypothetical protein
MSIYREEYQCEMRSLETKCLIERQKNKEGR